MPIINARTDRIETVLFVCRLQQPNRDARLAHAAFIGDTPECRAQRADQRHTGDGPQLPGVAGPTGVEVFDGGVPGTRHDAPVELI